MLFPFYWMLITSFKTLDDASALPPEYPGWMEEFQNREPRVLAKS